MISYFIVPLIAIITMMIGKFFTRTGMNWYYTISLPDKTPASWFISAVWQYLYILAALSALIVWNTFERDRTFWMINGLFVMNALLNVFWSYLFFTKHMIGAAFFDALALAVNLVALIWLIWPKSKKAAALLMPYLAWVCFACGLNFAIWLMN